MPHRIELLPVEAATAPAVAERLRRAVDGDRPPLLVVPPSGAAPELLAAAAVDDPVDDDVALLVPTSGSTGAPKVVELTGPALRASATATHERLGGPGRWLLALPGHHIAGLQVLLRSALAGTAPVALDPAAGSDPAQLAAAATALGDGPRYVSLVPTQVRRLAASAAGLDALAGFDAVLVGGAAVDGSLVARCRAAGVRLVATYGGTETCGGCVYDGRPLRDVRVRIGDGGRVTLGGPVLARGYRGRPDLTAAAFTADADGTRWFTTDDVGELAAGGLLRITGRADDVVVTGGLKVAPAPVEAALREHPAVREACVVGLPDAEWGQVVAAALVPAGDGPRPGLEELRDHVKARMGAAAAPRRVVWVAALPLRGPGKPDRAAVRALLGGEPAAVRIPP